MPTSRRMLVGVLATALLCADGYSPFIWEIPNGDQVMRAGVRWYGVGHYESFGSGATNPFGAAFAAAGFEWTAGLCAEDSDGDGQSNGLELGDPECVWSPRQNPSRTENISHPGFADSMTNASISVATTSVPTSTATSTSTTVTSTTATVASTLTSSSTTSTVIATAASTTIASTATASSTSTPSTTAAATTTLSASGTPPSAPESQPLAGDVAVGPDEERVPTQCDFDNEPLSVGHFWDASCEMGMLGCNADGKHVQCRLCGAEAFVDISCPPSSCHFVNEPFVPYYWDLGCVMGMLGCWADGIHAQCRFCGDRPYTSIECPSVVGGQGGLLVGGVAAAGDNSSCSFANEPAMPYYWDADCTVGQLGCLADGVHEQCRFCAQRPFEEILCPAEVAPPANRCTFPNGTDPTELYYWDAACELGMLGCWADGIHSECRFCGGASFRNVSCPTVRLTGAAAGFDRKSTAQVAAASQWRAGEARSESEAALISQDDEIDLSRAGRLTPPLSCGLAVILALLPGLPAIF